MRAVPLLCLALVLPLLAGCSDGAHDSDGDGLRDRTEKSWPSIVVDLMDRRIRLTPSSDIDLADTDGDGLGDFDEFFRKTDPRNNDTDLDGLTDCQETVHSVASECEDPAFAGDYDHGTGTSPVRADSDPGPVRYVNRPGYFTDETGTLAGGRAEWGDGLSDLQELSGYTIDLGGGRTRTVTSDPRDSDTDGDGLEDGEEAFLYGGDPTVTDTDGDACLDGQDPWPAREERLAIGLQTFRLKVDKDLTGGSDLAFSGQVAGEVFVAPQGNSIHVDKGQTVDLRSLSPPAQKPSGCPAFPSYPWVKIQIAASDQDPGSQPQAIDITSLTDAPDSGVVVPRLWWNLRTDEFAWDPDSAERLASPIVFEGVDAVLTFEPSLTFSQAS